MIPKPDVAYRVSSSADSLPDDRKLYVSSSRGRSAGRLAKCSVLGPWISPCPNFSENHPSYAPPDRNKPGEAAEPQTYRCYVFSRPLVTVNWYRSICVVTEEFARRISDQRFSGIEFRQMELFAKASCKELLDGYLELRVTGRVPADLVGSGISVEYQCGVCGAIAYSPWSSETGIRFEGDPKQWPDAFRISQMPYINFVTARFAQFLIDSAVDSVSLTDSTLLLSAWHM
jgi:hypothetical protein